MRATFAAGCETALPRADNSQAALLLSKKRKYRRVMGLPPPSPDLGPAEAITSEDGGACASQQTCLGNVSDGSIAIDAAEATRPCTFAWPRKRTVVARRIRSTSCRHTGDAKAFSVRGINTARMIATRKSAGTSPIK